MSGIPRDFSLVVLLLVSRLCDCFFGYPWLPLPGLWAVVWSGFRLAVALFVGFGFGLSILCPICGLGLFGGFTYWYLLVSVSG